MKPSEIKRDMPVKVNIWGRLQVPKIYIYIQLIKIHKSKKKMRLLFSNMNVECYVHFPLNTEASHMF